MWALRFGCKGEVTSLTPPESLQLAVQKYEKHTVGLKAHHQGLHVYKALL